MLYLPISPISLFIFIFLFLHNFINFPLQVFLFPPPQFYHFPSSMFLFLSPQFYYFPSSFLNSLSLRNINLSPPPPHSFFILLLHNVYYFPSSILIYLLLRCLIPNYVKVWSDQQRALCSFMAFSVVVNTHGL